MTKPLSLRLARLLLCLILPARGRCRWPQRPGRRGQQRRISLISSVLTGPLRVRHL
jgi:hypothetical protein